MSGTRKRKYPFDDSGSQPAKKAKVLSQREKNEMLGREAIAYSKQYILESCTLPTLKNREKIQEIYGKIDNVRKRIPDLAESIYLILRYPMNPVWRQIKFVVKSSKKFRVGNCGEYASLSLNFFRKKNVQRADYLTMVNSDHAFAAMDILGENSTIVDGLNDGVFHDSQIYLKLKAYRFDWNQTNPHILRPFTKDDKLQITYTIECKKSPQENRVEIKIHQIKLEIIKSACEKHLANEKLPECQQLFNSLECPDEIQLNEMTNFDLERHMDKHIKKLCGFIAKQSTDESEKIFAEILVKIVDTYPSYFHYLEDLLRTNNLFKFAYTHNVISGNMDMPNHLGCTALHIAIHSNNKEAVKLLVENGANPFIQNADGDDPISLARKNNNAELVSLLEQSKHFNSFSHLGITQALDTFGLFTQQDSEEDTEEVSRLFDISNGHY